MSRRSGLRGSASIDPNSPIEPTKLREAEKIGAATAFTPRNASSGAVAQPWLRTCSMVRRKVRGSVMVWSVLRRRPRVITRSSQSDGPKASAVLPCAEECEFEHRADAQVELHRVNALDRIDDDDAALVGGDGNRHRVAALVAQRRHFRPRLAGEVEPVRQRFEQCIGPAAEQEFAARRVLRGKSLFHQRMQVAKDSPFGHRQLIGQLGDAALLAVRQRLEQPQTELKRLHRIASFRRTSVRRRRRLGIGDARRRRVFGASDGRSLTCCARRLHFVL